MISELSIFSNVCWPSVCLLWKHIYSCPPPHLIRFLILSCMSPFYILDIIPLSGTLFVNVFSHSVGGIFILLIVYFTVGKLFSLMKSNLFIFAFAFLARRDRPKKVLLKQMSKSVLLMFPSRSFRFYN